MRTNTDGKLAVNLPTLHPGQAQVVREAKRHCLILAGRRFGKSVLLRDRLIHAAVAGSPTAWISPTFRMLSESWRSILETLQPLVAEANVSERRITLVTGGSCDFWSGDALETIRGRAYKLICVDEAALLNELEQKWTQILRPCLTDHKGGSFWGSTPRGFGYLKVLFDRGQDPDNPEWKSWQFKSTENPYIAEAEIETARSEMGSASFDQEYNAAWVDSSGSVFRNVYELATVTPLDGPKKGGGPYVFGIDWSGSGKGDYTVVAILDAGSRELVRLERWRTSEYALQLGRVKGLYEHWRPALVIGESNSLGAPLIAQLRHDGVPIQEFVTTNLSKAAAVEQLALAFERRTIRTVADPVLLGELQAFQAQRLPSGATRYAAAGGSHDDTVMALILTWAAVETTQAEETIIVTSDDYETLKRIGRLDLFIEPPRYSGF